MARALLRYMDGVEPACAALHGDLRHPGIAVADLRRLRRHVLERRTLVEGVREARTRLRRGNRRSIGSQLEL